MLKFLIIGTLGAVLLFLINRSVKLRFNSYFKSYANQHPGYQHLSTNPHFSDKTLKNAAYTALIGVFLLVAIIILALKIKILLILLPISLYLVAQLPLLLNHLNATDLQQIWYNSKTETLIIQQKNRPTIQLNVLRDISQIVEYTGVQKNKGVLVSYFRLLSKNNKEVKLSFLLYRNSIENQHFFNTLKDNFLIKRERRLLPFI